MAEGNLPPTEVFDPDPPDPLMPETAPAEPFPLHCLPAILKQGVDGIVAEVQCPPVLAIMSVISSAAFVAQAHVDVTLINGQTAPTSLFIVAVAESGDRKTSADKLATKPIRDVQAERLREATLEKKEYESAMEVHRAARKRVFEDHKQNGGNLQAALSALGREPDPPLMPILLCEDPTFEGLIKLAQFGPGYTGLFSNEGGQFVGGHGMNEDNRRKTAAGLCKAWEGGEITRIRGGDDLQALHNRRFAMNVMLQPGVAADLFGDDSLLDQGFLSRILPAWPVSNMGSRVFIEASQAAKAKLNAYWRRLRALLDLDVPVVEDTRNELAPRVLELEAEAHAALVAFYNLIEPQLAEDGPLRPIAGLAAKAAEHAARIAGVFTFIDDEAASTVSGPTMENAIHVMHWFLTEALRIAGALKTPREILDADAIMRWLGKSWGHTHVGVPDLQRYGPNRLRRDRKALEAAIRILVDHRYFIPAAEVRVEGALRKVAWRWRPGAGL